jgi:formate dehydrogenase assembly factor FdhD
MSHIIYEEMNMNRDKIMNEKQLIQIKRIQQDNIIEKHDEVAVEYALTIPLEKGGEIQTTCAPTHIEELILGRRFGADDLPALEMAQDVLEEVSLEEIFSIAKNSFETPGSLFADTGCAHSCVLVHNGQVVRIMDDIGRHNALDKVIGYAIKHKISCSGSYVFASGRIAGDYIQKAHKAGFRMVVSRAAVTSSAVAFAKEQDITLLGFIRKNTGNIYHEGKVKLNG